MNCLVLLEQMERLDAYGVPTFVARGYYLDIESPASIAANIKPGKPHKKMVVEIAHGNVESRAVRCRACRKIEHDRRDRAKILHQKGLKTKGLHR